MKIKIQLNPNSLNDIGKFVLLMKSFHSDINLYKGAKYVDAKMIQDVLSIDTSNNCEVEILSNDERELKMFDKIIEEWRIKE